MRQSLAQKLTIRSVPWAQTPPMDPTQIGLFDLAEQRLAWVDQRQSVLAQNIANVSTPHFQPSDLPSFASTLDNVGSVLPVRTNPAHMAGTLGAGPLRPVVENDQHGPDGNGVALDTQLTKVADTGTTQSLVTNIYKKYMSLFSMALGHSSS
jgi:flagellar basal-body rod protein FlgB